jgi:ATP-dependent Clp protease ATP-binding subunit ClpB
VLDDGRLTDNQGRTVDFTNTIIIMTSNMGSDVISERMDEVDGHLSDAQQQELEEEVLKMLRRQVKPEFLNRIDDIVMFRSLSRAHIREIVEIQFQRVQRLAAKNHDLTLTLSDDAKDWLADRGYDPAFGARPLKRVMKRHVANGLSQALLDGTIEDGDTVRIELAEDEEGLTFETVSTAPASDTSTNGTATVET